MTTTQTCKKCDKVLPLDEFYKNRLTSSGHTSSCKTCQKEYTRIWKKNNRAKVGLQRRRWKDRNPELRRAQSRVDRQRRRARNRQASGYFTREQWQARLDYHGNKCYYCTSEHNLTIDHRIPLSRGGTNWPSNLVPACHSCNSKKNNKTETEYVQM
jgi:5-methylcytosine-specific restriction endonuclease McrA